MIPIPPALAPLSAQPLRTALVFAVDGVLAPLARRPEDARVPDTVREALQRLAQRFGMVAVVSARRAEDARRLVGLEALTYAGNGGLELLQPGSDTPLHEADVDAEVAAAFMATIDPALLAAADLRLEVKGPVQVLHWRAAASPLVAEMEATRVANLAGDFGLHTAWGRSAVELRPPCRFDKGTAVQRLVGDRFNRVAHFAAGPTDLAAWHGLDRLVAIGDLQRAVKVVVDGPGTPWPLRRHADVYAPAIGAFHDLLSRMPEA